jgi:YHS domain-containing protein
MSPRLLLAAAAIALAPAALFTSPAEAQTAVYTERFSNLALQGYDPVAYFTAGEPVRGTRQFSHTHKGSTYRFSSAEHRDNFIADPDAYLPEYGGFCAWAAAQGYRAKGDARYWRIVDGRLYLNFNAQVQKDWEADIPGFIAAADEKWPELGR